MANSRTIQIAVVLAVVIAISAIIVSKKIQSTLPTPRPQQSIIKGKPSVEHWQLMATVNSLPRTKPIPRETIERIVDILETDEFFRRGGASLPNNLRSEFYRDLIRLDPSNVDYYRSKFGDEVLSAAERADLRRTQVESEKQRLARLATRNPTIGMSANDVVIGAWGFPSSRNITKTGSGSHEQWVYEGAHRGYLYFENGTLVAIQTTH